MPIEPVATFSLDFECSDTDICDRLDGRSVIVDSVLLTLSVVTPTPTSTETPTHTPTPTPSPVPTDTPTPFPTPIPTDTPTPTPTPLPETREYIEPEFITLATSTINDTELEKQVWGRELRGNERSNVVLGITSWTTDDFERKCLIDEREHQSATELVRQRYSDAEFVRDLSDIHYYEIFCSSFGMSANWLEMFHG